MKNFFKAVSILVIFAGLFYMFYVEILNFDYQKSKQSFKELTTEISSQFSKLENSDIVK